MSTVVRKNGNILLILVHGFDNQFSRFGILDMGADS